MPESRLRVSLNRLRTRLLLIDGARAICWSLLAVVVGVLVAGWLDLLWELSGYGRIAAVLVAVVAAIAIFGYFAYRIVAHIRTRALARKLDEAAGGSGAVISGWELEQGAYAAPREDSSSLTTGLAQLAVQEATVTAERVNVAQAVPARRAQNASLALGVSLVAVTLLVALLPSLARTQFHRFLHPFDDVPPYSAIEFEVSPGDTQVVYGQGLDVRATLSGAPVERVNLIITAGDESETLPMFPEGEGKWRATVARVIDPLHYHVTADRARSRRHEVGVITTPNIESVRFRIAPPDYTRDAPYDGPLPKGGIAALPGTKVEVRAQSNRPLSGGKIELELGKEKIAVEMKPAAANSDEVTGAFTVTRGGKFTVSVTDVAGQASQEPLVGSITLLSDQRPFVRLMEPRSQSFATPTAAIPVTASAEDDYGLTRAQLFRSLNDSRPLPTELAVAAPAPRRLQDQVYLPLAQYGLRPGDTIKLFSRVEDNDPAGAKGAESTLTTIQIISQEDFERMLRVQRGLEVLLSKYQQAERRMEALAEKIEQLQQKLANEPADSPAAEKLREELMQLTNEMKVEAAAIAESAKHLLPYDIDEALSQKLTDLAKALDEAAEEAAAAAENPAAKNSDLKQELEKMAKKLRGNRDQFQKEASEPLAHLAKVYPLLEAQSRFVNLVLAQKDLAERLAALKGMDNVDDPAVKARMRDLEEEQRKYREELSNLLDDIEAHAAELPDEKEFAELWKTSLEFVTLVRASGAGEKMSGAEAALAEFNGTRGHEDAQRAAEILESFLSKCQGMGQEGEQCLAFSPSLGNCLGNSIQQMLAEAGLGNGQNSGFGQGSGGGYSARRGTANNVGLYGGLPGQGQVANSGRGQSGQGRDGTGNFAAGGTTSDPSLIESPTSSAASGAAQGAAPLRYRERVGQYIQRITEEVKE